MHYPRKTKSYRGLLTREQFRNSVFARDEYRCVICGESLDTEEERAAHHIIDRKCFSDGGYYIDNGATLCNPCHWEAEQGHISPERIRAAARIKVIVIPAQFDATKKYDKWGKEV